MIGLMKVKGDVIMAKSIKQMEREINELTNVETFYEDVRKIVGYYNPKVFIEDWDIKRLQRVADARYAEIGGR